MWRSFTWENLSVCNAHLWQLPICQITVPNTTNTRNHTYHVVGNLLLPFCLKSNLMACHTVWLSIIMGSASALSKIKKLRRKVNHSALSGAPTGAALLWKKFALRGKIFSSLGCAIVRSELPRRSSMNGFFVATTKNTEADQNSLWKHLTWMTLNRSLYWWFLTAKLTRHWSISVHVSCVMLSHDLWRNKLKEFPNSPEVMLFLKPESFFQSFLLSIAGC